MVENMFIYAVLQLLTSNTQTSNPSRPIGSDWSVWCVASTSLDAGTVLESVPLLICAGFVYCHCTRRWEMFHNTHGKDSGVYSAKGLLYSHNHDP